MRLRRFQPLCLNTAAWRRLRAPPSIGFLCREEALKLPLPFSGERCEVDMGMSYAELADLGHCRKVCDLRLRPRSVRSRGSTGQSAEARRLVHYF